MTRTASLLALALLSAGAVQAASHAPRWDTIQPAADELVVRGSLRTSLDGTTFDGISQRAGEPGAEPRLGGLFDLEAGGLRVIEQDAAAHVYRLAGTGRPGDGCQAAGVPSPCLVPRLRLLALERLVTTDALVASLSGSVEIESVPPPALSTAQGRALGATALLLAGAAAWALGGALRRRRRDTAIGQVHLAAAEARRGLRGDPTLRSLQTGIDALVIRAEELEQARRACARRLARIDRAGLQERRLQWLSRGEHPDAAHALATLATEAQEAAQLETDLAASQAGIDRIASTLRSLALRTRAHRGTRARTDADDPVDRMQGELALRESALSEAERLARG